MANKRIIGWAIFGSAFLCLLWMVYSELGVYGVLVVIGGMILLGSTLYLTS